MISELTTEQRLATLGPGGASEKEREKKRKRREEREREKISARHPLEVCSQL